MVRNLLQHITLTVQIVMKWGNLVEEECFRFFYKKTLTNISLLGLLY